jgi:hypothetical protein
MPKPVIPKDDVETLIDYLIAQFQMLQFLPIR